MSGVTDVINYGAAAAGGGAVVGSWGNIYGHLLGNNAYVAVSGFTGAHQIDITWTGSPRDVFVVTTTGYIRVTATGNCNVTPGEQICFLIYSENASVTASGTVTITDATAGGAAVDSFNYVVTAP